MFYSHTILARKGPLGTVWCAAHLQNRLTKSQYTSTNIRSTIERIMFPEVPIALRMSGHLLLGVVRIYSKQVEYLYKECNVVLFRIKETFSTANVNLPENANHAPFHSITLPETFELDAMEFEDDFTENGFDDKYKKNLDEITFTDQIPTDRDPYVAFIIDDDVLRAVAEDDEGSEAVSMEEDSLPPVPEGIADYGREPSSNDPAGADNRSVEDSIRQDSPDLENLRDPGRQRGHPVLSDILPPDLVLDKQIQEDKEAPTPRVEPLPLNPQAFNSSAPVQFPQNADENISSEGHSPDSPIRSSHDLASGASVDFAIQASSRVLPPQAVQPVAGPQRPKRKRRQHFDNTTVLTNAFMKRSLAETNDIKRVLRNVPCSSLEVWRSNKRLMREEIFDEPLLTGLSRQLANCFEPEYISTRAHGVVLENAESEPETDIHPEVERPCGYEGPGTNVLPEMPDSSPSRDIPSSTRLDAFTPSTANLVSGSEQFTIGTGILQTPDLAGSTLSNDTDMITAETSGHRHGFEHTPLYDIRESSGELDFLEHEDNSPGSLRTPQQSDRSSKKKEGAQESDRLSSRARAVANYLKGRSSATPMSGGPFVEDSHTISLNTILEGKTRKVAARMFFEILALQNANFVKVQQKDAYGDIRLNVLPKLVDDL